MSRYLFEKTLDDIEAWEKEHYQVQFDPEFEIAPTRLKDEYLIYRDCTRSLGKDRKTFGQWVRS